MNKKLLTVTMAVSLGMISGGSYAGDTNDLNQAKNNICLLTGMPPAEVQYQTIKKVKVGKHSYGSVNDVIPLLVDQAKQVNADAIIGYNGSQRFGFWPWQFVRPTATGIAVTWALPEGITCEGLGGTYKTRLQGPLTTDA